MPSKYIQPEIWEIVYGIRAKNGRMLYVGKSISGHVRANSHFNPSGKLNKLSSHHSKYVNFGSFPRDVAAMLEKELIRHYWAKGECKYNKRICSPKARLGGMYRFECPQLKMRFDSRSIAAMFFDVSVKRIKNFEERGRHEPLRYRGQSVFLRKI